MHAFQISTALSSDIPELVRLINSAYRGESSKKGWTTEADLIEGDRMNADSLDKLLNTPGILIQKCVHPSEGIVGCVCLEIKEDEIHVGLLTVSPDIQAQGIGKLLLNDAEDMARNLGIPILSMEAISLRTELILYYIRRGFQLTGKKIKFPEDNPYGSRPLEPLELVELKKPVETRPLP